MAGAHSLGSSAKNWCAFARALLLYPRCGAGCAWRNTHANCHWLVLLTLEDDWALGRDPISQSHWRYVSVPSFRERGLHLKTPISAQRNSTPKPTPHTKIQKYIYIFFLSKTGFCMIYKLVSSRGQVLSETLDYADWWAVNVNWWYSVLNYLA